MTDCPTDTVDLQKRKEANLFKASSKAPPDALLDLLHVYGEMTRGGINAWHWLMIPTWEQRCWDYSLITSLATLFHK